MSRDAIVGVVGSLVAAVGARDEPDVVTKLQRHLEDEGHVAAAVLGDGAAVVDHEEGEGPRARREAGRVGGHEAPFEPQPVGAGDLLALREPRGVECDAQANGAPWDADICARMGAWKLPGPAKKALARVTPG